MWFSSSETLSRYQRVLRRRCQVYFKEHHIDVMQTRFQKNLLKKIRLLWTYGMRDTPPKKLKAIRDDYSYVI